jgi:hypothetical protein
MSSERQGVKHIIECRCILPQFKNAFDPPFHKFRVFSIIDENDAVVLKYTQCNYCGIVHKVTDIGTSEIMKGREELKSIMTIADVRHSIPTELAEILDQNNADIALWEQAKFVLQSKTWGEILILSTEIVDDMRQGKYVRILGEKLFDIQVYASDVVIANE